MLTADGTRRREAGGTFLKLFAECVAARAAARPVWRCGAAALRRDCVHPQPRAQAGLEGGAGSRCQRPEGHPRRRQRRAARAPAEAAARGGRQAPAARAQRRRGSSSSRAGRVSAAGAALNRMLLRVLYTHTRVPNRPRVRRPLLARPCGERAAAAVRPRVRASPGAHGRTQCNARRLARGAPRPALLPRRQRRWQQRRQQSGHAQPPPATAPPPALRRPPWQPCPPGAPPSCASRAPGTPPSAP
jgi:hypothetical protein